MMTFSRTVSFLLLATLLGVDAGCFIDNPELLAKCISFDLNIFISISKNELFPVCLKAQEYLNCASAFASDCPAQNTLQGVLKDLGKLIIDCCNVTTGPAPLCPVVKKTQTCFPSGSSVVLASGQKKLIEHLQIGDVIKVASNDGHIVDSEVIMFTDRSETLLGEYLELKTQAGQVLRVSSSHLVALRLNDAITYKHASTLQIGDVMLVGAGRQQLASSPIVSVSKQLLRGAFAPLTMEGSLLVDDVAASCYAVVSEHWIGHTAFAPLRALHRVSKSVLDMPAFARQESGLHWVASAMWQLTAAVMPSVVSA